MERKTAVNKKLFPLTKLHKKRKRKSFLWILQTECSKNLFTPSFGNTMLYAVLFIRCVWKYAGEVREIYSFFGVGKKREGKSSFCIFFGKRVGQNTKCTFSFAVGYRLSLILAVCWFYFSVVSILVSVSSFISVVSNTIKAVACFYFTTAYFIISTDNIINAVTRCFVAVKHVVFSVRNI